MVVRRRANTNSSVRRTPTISQWDTSSRPPISNDIYHPVALILSQTSFHRMIRDLCEIFLQLIVNYLIRFFEDRVILRNLQDRSDMEDRIIGVLKYFCSRGSFIASTTSSSFPSINHPACSNFTIVKTFQDRSHSRYFTL